MIILANVVDQILGLNGAATVLFYIANEGLSIIENLAEVDVVVPKNLAKRIRSMMDQEGNSQRITEEIRNEFNDKEGK